MASLTVSLISFKSPTVKVIRSREVLLALDFFRGPTFFGYLLGLMRNGIVSRFAPPWSDC